MVEFAEGLVEVENDGREDSNAANDAEKDAFGHNETKIKTHGESHETKGNEASDGGGGTTKDGA